MMCLKGIVVGLFALALAASASAMGGMGGAGGGMMGGHGSSQPDSGAGHNHGDAPMSGNAGQDQGQTSPAMSTGRSGETTPTRAPPDPPRTSPEHNH